MYNPPHIKAHPAIRVGLIKRNNMLREDLKSHFYQDSRFRLIFCTNDNREAIKIAGLSPDVILWSIDTTSIISIKIINELREIFTGSKIVVLSRTIDPVFSQKIMQYGLDGLLLTTDSINYIKESLLNVPQGGIPISPIAVRHLLSQSTNKATGVFTTLTKREFELVQALSSGISNKSAAELLNVKFSTVNEHLKHIYKKLNINAKTELIAMTKTSPYWVQNFNSP